MYFRKNRGGMHIHEYACISMNMHAYPWICMHIHRYACISIDMHAYPSMCMMYHDAYALRITCGGVTPPRCCCIELSAAEGGIPPHAIATHWGGIPPLGGLGDIRLPQTDIGELKSTMKSRLQRSFFVNTASGCTSTASD